MFYCRIQLLILLPCQHYNSLFTGFKCAWLGEVIKSKARYISAKMPVIRTVILSGFYLVCIYFAIDMTVKQFSKYSRNEDTSSVKIKSFRQDRKSTRLNSSHW